MASVGFESAFCFQGLWDIGIEAERLESVVDLPVIGTYALGADAQMLKAKAQALGSTVIVEAANEVITTTRRLNVVTMVINDIVFSMPIIAQISGTIQIIRGVSLLRNTTEPEWRSAYKGCIVRGVVTACNLSPILAVTDPITSLAVLIIHQSRGNRSKT